MVVSSSSSQGSSKAGVTETVELEAATVEGGVEAGRVPKLGVYSLVQCMIFLISQHASKSALAVLELSLAA